MALRRRYLLDVSVVLAVVDPAHENHALSSRWFHEEGRSSFATCPIVENGVMRIASSQAYPNRAGDVDVVRQVLNRLCNQEGHVFWADTVSLRTAAPANSGIRSNEVTDLYLLALAKANDGIFVTFDQRIRPDLLSAGEHLRMLR